MALPAVQLRSLWSTRGCHSVIPGLLCSTCREHSVRGKASWVCRAQDLHPAWAQLNFHPGGRCSPQPLVRCVFHPLARGNQSQGLTQSEGDMGMNIRWVCGLELTSQGNDADWYWKAQLWGSQEWVCSSPFNWNCSPLLGASSVLRKVRNVRTDFESYSEQLTMKTGLLFILLLKLFVQRVRQSTVVSCQPPSLVLNCKLK